jgi:hypothetical protein
VTQAASHAPARPARAARPEPLRLRLIGSGRQASRLPFLALTGLVVILGVLGLAALTVAVNQQAFAIARLEQAGREAAGRYSVLQADVDRLRAPARLGKVAEDRGLAPVGRTRVVRWPSAPERRGAAASGGDAAASRAAPAAAAPPAAAGPPPPARPGADPGRIWTPDDPFPLKQYLAQP